MLRIPETNDTLNYQDELGVEHTKSQVDKIRRHGVQILSYFIDSKYNGKNKVNENDPLRHNFRRMYGKTSKFIRVDSVVELANTINQLFLTREQ